VELHNAGTRTQRLRLVGIFEWVMGTRRSDRGSVRTALASLASPRDRSMRIDALLATQRDSNAGFGGSTAFVVARFTDSPNASLDDWTCDRRELFDSAGRRAIPDRLGKCAGVGLDPCGAVAMIVTLAPAKRANARFTRPWRYARCRARWLRRRSRTRLRDAARRT
jgi:cyclic beta-1,2-glucan synthetase